MESKAKMIGRKFEWLMDHFFVFTAFGFGIIVFTGLVIAIAITLLDYLLINFIGALALICVIGFIISMSYLVGRILLGEDDDK